MCERACLSTKACEHNSSQRDVSVPSCAAPVCLTPCGIACPPPTSVDAYFAGGQSPRLSTRASLYVCVPLCGVLCDCRGE